MLWQPILHISKNQSIRGNAMKTYVKILLKDFLGVTVDKNLPASAGDTGSISDPGRPLREGNGNWLQYSCLGNPIDRRAWWAIVRGVTRSRPRLSDSTVSTC